MIVEELTDKQTRALLSVSKEAMPPFLHSLIVFLNGCKRIKLPDDAASSAFSQFALFHLTQVVAKGAGVSPELLTLETIDQIATEMQILLVTRVNELNGFLKQEASSN